MRIEYSIDDTCTIDCRLLYLGTVQQQNPRLRTRVIAAQLRSDGKSAVQVKTFLVHGGRLQSPAPRSRLTFARTSYWQNNSKIRVGTAGNGSSIRVANPGLSSSVNSSIALVALSLSLALSRNRPKSLSSFKTPAPKGSASESSVSTN
jgi:hypothetical protein